MAAEVVARAHRPLRGSALAYEHVGDANLDHVGLSGHHELVGAERRSVGLGSRIGAASAGADRVSEVMAGVAAGRLEVEQIQVGHIHDLPAGR